MVEKNNLISVIVPVYNAEKYLHKCINSIINQTYKNLEIILVDDGSTDSSGRICEEYANKDNRIIVIHKENGGQGLARKIGIEKSTGEYIGFVDSDDYIANEMYEFLYNRMVNCSADISVCGRINVFEDAKETKLFCCSEQVWDSQEAVRNFLLYNDIDGSLCDKLFKKEFMMSIEFPHELICEDLTVVYNCLCKAKKIIHIGKPYYYYLHRIGSTSHSTYNPKSIGQKIYPQNILQSTISLFPSLIPEAESYYFRNVAAYLKRLCASDEIDLYKTECRDLKKNFIFKVIKSKYINKNTKRDLILHLLLLYRPVRKFYNKLKS